MKWARKLAKYSLRDTRRKNPSVIQAIKSNSTIIKDPKGINKQFKEFYEELYKSETTTTDQV